MGTILKCIYLDYAATTPVDPGVARAMQDCLTSEGAFGNPSSNHLFGRRAAQRVETARTQVAGLISAEPEEIVFTSGATESNNLVLLGVARANADRGRHIVTSRIEHKAVLDPCKRLEKEGFTVTYLTPDQSGRIDPQAVKAALRADTVLVSIMHVNNEIGVIQDIGAIGALCREHGIAYHTDAAQSVGKLPLNVTSVPIDFLSFTAHKLYGPKGIGALYVRKASRPLLQAVSFGGGQERGLRPGTLPVSQIVGFGAACEIAGQVREEDVARIEELRERLWQGLSQMEGVHLNGAGASRVAGILNVSFEGVEGESLVTALPALAVSTGSACNSATDEPSYVLRALGRSTQLAESSLRFSLGRFTSKADVDGAIALVRAAVQRLRAVSPAAQPVATIRSPGKRAQSPQLDALPPADFEPTRSEVAGAPPSEADVLTAQQHEVAASSATWPTPVEAGELVAPASDAILSLEGDVLSPFARQYFEALPYAGAIPDTGGQAEGQIIRGEAGAAGRETWVRFHLLVVGDTVKDARFQAFGCPHTLAVTAWLAAQLPGKSRDLATIGGPMDWAQALQVPTEKLGRLLVVEDALGAALRRWP